MNVVQLCQEEVIGQQLRMGGAQELLLGAGRCLEGRQGSFRAALQAAGVGLYGADVGVEQASRLLVRWLRMDCGARESDLGIRETAPAQHLHHCSHRKLAGKRAWASAVQLQGVARCGLTRIRYGEPADVATRDVSRDELVACQIAVDAFPWRIIARVDRDAECRLAGDRCTRLCGADLDPHLALVTCVLRQYGSGCAEQCRRDEGSCDAGTRDHHDVPEL